ncbi:hypothetical protein [Novosphingobium aureum]|uniref:hypothetical protein n=1 Tax=Novosphingobium aureum TaxID=2792964 RepID=UPI002B48E02B|nr:hypothetical protein [Novosphingobium aureum]
MTATCQTPATDAPATHAPESRAHIAGNARAPAREQRPAPDRHAGRLLGALALLVLALVLRASTFGDPNLHPDETFYQSVGLAMHHGAVPYVDVWDRKPWGLFALYYLIGWLGTDPLGYQIVATLFAWGTALTIAALAQCWCSARGALLAGAAYLLWLETFQGFGGQSPIFYNLFMALGALLTFTARGALREGRVTLASLGAMLLAGLAITIKTTAVFEACYMGLACAIQLWRAPLPARARIGRIGVLALTGAAPMLAISLGYALAGYWNIYWHAMVTSNLAKPSSPATAAIRATILFMRIAPLLICLTMALPVLAGPSRRFVLGWIGAALIGLLAVPAFHLHYALPLLVPLCVAAAAFFQHRLAGPLALLAMACLTLPGSRVIDFSHARRSRAAMEQLVAAVERGMDRDARVPLFIYDGPPQLYALTCSAYPSPLVFPAHLEHAIEKDVSHLSTRAEVARVLALTPAVVITSPEPREKPVNAETLALVNDYVHANCQPIAQVDAPEWLHANRFAVWGHCRNRATR